MELTREPRLTGTVRHGPFAASSLLPLCAMLVIALPIAAVIWFGLTMGGGPAWDHVLNNRLLPYTATTLGVLGLTGLLILAFALPAAWLVSHYDFPGRRLFEWALILPLAMPGYVMAYAWGDLASVSGPIHAAFRDLTGLSAREYWLPDLFSLPGLAFVLASTLYPYVYLTARAAFTHQSLATLEVARSLGATGAQRFWRVALPAARPAILAGLVLALMEAAADYGAADYLGVQTLGVGIVRSWTSFGEPATAARLSFVLILIAFALFGVSRWLQGTSGPAQSGSRWLTPTRTHLRGPALFAGIAVCSVLFLVTFLVPLCRLAWLSLASGVAMPAVWPALGASLVLAGAGTLLALACAFAAVIGMRTLGGWAQYARLVPMAGYASPGVVLGLGALLLLKTTGVTVQSGGAFALLICVYATRFTAAGAEPMQAAYARAPRSIDFAARSLGASGSRRFWQLDLPLVLPGALVGGLILFVEILKELPATLMLRPLGLETLAVRAHNYATDERLAQATLPSLLITLAGLVPVMVLSWRMSKGGFKLQ